MALQDVIRYIAEPATGSGLNVYCIIFNGNASGVGQVYQQSGSPGWVNCVGANWSTYALVLTERCNGVYSVALPTGLQVPNKNYDVVFYQRTTGTPTQGIDILLGSTVHSMGNIGVQVLPSVPSSCVDAGDSVRFLLSCTTEDGATAPINVVTSTTGTGSAVATALAGNGSLFQITYTSALGAAGTEDTVVCNVEFGFPIGLGTSGSIFYKVAVPIKICEVSGSGLTSNQIADAVWKAKQLVQSDNTTAWPAGSMGISVNLNADGLQEDAVTEIKLEVDDRLSNIHGFGAWGGGGGGFTLAQISDAVWNANNETTAITNLPWAIGTMGYSVNLDDDGVTADAASFIGSATNVILTQAHGPGQWVTGTSLNGNQVADSVWGALRANTFGTGLPWGVGTFGSSISLRTTGLENLAATAIAEATDVVLSREHGDGQWGGGGGGGGFTLPQMADAVWSALRSQDSTTTPWGSGTMGSSINITSSGIDTTASSLLASVNDIVLSQEHGPGLWTSNGGLTVQTISDGVWSASRFTAGATNLPWGPNSMGTSVNLTGPGIQTTAVTKLVDATNVRLSEVHGAGLWLTGGGGGGGGSSLEITFG